MIDFDAITGQLTDWKVVNNHHLERKFKFKDFADGLMFVNDVARLAEQAQHHPEIFLTWGKVRIVCYTHDINGISERDINLASAIDEMQTTYQATA